jgi:hypothetical protein
VTAGLDEPAASKALTDLQIEVARAFFALPAADRFTAPNSSTFATARANRSAVSNRTRTAKAKPERLKYGRTRNLVSSIPPCGTPAASASQYFVPHSWETFEKAGTPASPGREGARHADKGP